LASLRFYFSVWMFCFGLLALSIPSFAQNKPADSSRVPIEILQADGLQMVQTDTGGINKLIGNVHLKQGESLMYCDSAYFYLERNSLEAFGNVKIVQPGSNGESDYMRYQGNTKKAYMRGNVMLTDGASNLWSEEVDYDMAAKIGTYAQGGTLQDSATTLSSNSGIYNMKTKDARFMGDVLVTNPDYHIVSDDMGYNTQTKLTTFFAHSVVTSDSSVLMTTSGTYDTRNQLAHFTSRSSIINKEQNIEADTIDYDKVSGIGKAKGHVVAIDTLQKTTLYSGVADYNEKKRTMLATIKPVLKQMNGSDSLFIRADTLYSAPIPRAEDTIMIERVMGKGKNKKTVRIPMADTMASDSSRPRYFIAYHHVLIFSDSLQGRCDSLSYSQDDSVMKMMYDPIVWSRNSQITGDTILLYMDSSKLKKLYVPNNGFMISQSGPEKAKLFDQVQGKTLTGNFTDNAITDMLVRPQAETIYYTTDDYGAYIGVTEVNGESMRILFADQKIDKILYLQDVKQKMTPLNQADLPNMKLSRFQWHIDKRPKSLSELFE
jgi:lipopolysaccharide export system protein LptA